MGNSKRTSKQPKEQQKGGGLMRPADEIKKGLECCSNVNFVCNEECPYYKSLSEGEDCCLKKNADALALIQQLQAENAEKDWKIQQLEATVSEKEKVVAELSGKIGQLEADNKLLQDAVDQWELVAASPGAVEDMARENTELREKVEQLQAERDAAVACIPRACAYCKWYGTKHGGFFPDCKNPNGCRNVRGINTGWEWRGVQKEEEP